MRTARSAFVFGLTVAAIVAAAVPAIASAKRATSLKNLPAACYVIFQTEREAATYCPVGIKPTKVFDFWQHNFLGWSCDCGPTDALPYQPDDGSSDPIDV